MKHQYFLRLVAGHLLTRLPANYILRMAKPLPASNLNELYIMAPVLMCPSVPNTPALAKAELQEYDEVWVEPLLRIACCSKSCVAGTV